METKRNFKYQRCNEPVFLFLDLWNSEMIQNHSVQFNTVFEFEATAVMHKDTNVLQPCELSFQMKQEVNGGRPEEIGSLTINLSEFANTPNVIKRFLLQNSKINSVMRLTLNLTLIKGDPIYKVYDFWLFTS
jgi:hypothetical protein